MATMPDQSDLSLAAKLDPRKQQTKKEQLCTLVVKTEKRKKKIQTIDHQRQSNRDVFTRNHVEEGTAAYLVK
jgi:hypothetical protein